MINKRGKGVANVGFGSREGYNFLMKSARNTSNDWYKDLTRGKYRDILRDFHREIAKAIIYDNYEFRMPSMGSIRIKKYKSEFTFDENNKLKTNKMSVDYPATKKLWNENPKAKENKQLVFLINDHSDGYRYKWTYDKRRAVYTNQNYYFFVPCRDNSRELAKALKDIFINVDYYM